MNALLDQNDRNSLIAVLNTDTVQGTNKVRIKLKESNNGVLINTSATISFTMVPVAPNDENYRGVALFEGSDGLPYPIVGTADGELLVEM